MCALSLAPNAHVYAPSALQGAKSEHNLYFQAILVKFLQARLHLLACFNQLRGLSGSATARAAIQLRRVIFMSIAFPDARARASFIVYLVDRRAKLTPSEG